MDITAKSLDPFVRAEGLANFTIHDTDNPGEGVYPKYYGMAHNSGAFMIMKRIDVSTDRYYIGRDAYVASWAVHDTLTYDYIFNMDWENL